MSILVHIWQRCDIVLYAAVVTVYWRQIRSSLESGERRLDILRSGEQDAVRGFQYFPHCSPVACEA